MVLFGFAVARRTRAVRPADRRQRRRAEARVGVPVGADAGRAPPGGRRGRRRRAHPRARASGKKVAAARHARPEGQARRRRRARRRPGRSPRCARPCWRSGSRRRRRARRWPAIDADGDGRSRSCCARRCRRWDGDDDDRGRRPRRPRGRGGSARRRTEVEFDAALRPRVAGGVRRAGPHQGAARPADRRRAPARRARRPPAVQRAAGARQDHARPDRRATRWAPGSGRPQRPGARAPGDLAAILTNLEEGDVLFVDEVHRMPRTVEEVLYPALEDFKLDVVIGKGPSARSIRLDLPRFTLVAATTRPGRITLPLRERFGFSPAPRLLLGRGPARIVRTLGRHPRASTIDEDGADEIARRSRGHPAHRQPAAAPGPRLRRGPRRRRDHRRRRAGRPRAVRGRRGRARQARPRDPARASIERVRRRPGRAVDARGGRGGGARHHRGRVEPYLLQLGFLKRTPRGRVATERAYRHLGITAPGTLPL